MQQALRAVLAGFPLVVLAACTGHDGMMDQAATTPAAPSLAVVDQNVSGDKVTILAATMPADGWVVIHEIVDGKVQAPQSIGHTAVKAGPNANVVVALDKPVPPGSTLLAMLHSDTGTIGIYEFGPGAVDNDKPIVAGGKPVVEPFKTL